MGLMLFTSWRDAATVATLGSWFWFVATKLKPRNNWCVFALGGMPGESGQATDAQIQACADDTLQWFPHENENYTNISHQAQMHHLLLQPLRTHQLTASLYLSSCVFLVTSGCSGGELGVKMKSVFRSSDCGFEWRPHFLPVQPL